MTAEQGSTAALELVLEEEFNRLYERLQREEKKGGEILWGGFFRRLYAFSVDLLVLSILSFALFYFVYTGYSVGLAAHQQTFSGESLDGFLFLCLVGWLSLVTGYFVLLHGMAGQTLGKWLLGLRIVGANQAPITYRQALVRWAGSWVSALMGAGMLWILFHPQKRGWHDLIAGTWVIREKKLR